MNLSLRALYETGPFGECSHPAARVVCDVAVSRWYVECAACGGAGPTADTEADARATWRELVEFVEVLDVWNAAQRGDADAQFAVDLAAGRQCGHPCADYFTYGECACTALTRGLVQLELEAEVAHLAVAALAASENAMSESISTESITAKSSRGVTACR